MKLSNNSNLSFQHKILMDIGASNPKGTLKIRALTDCGKEKMLNEGDYVMGVMTGGGFGSVDIKVKGSTVEFETSESSSYIAGNHADLPSTQKLMKLYNFQVICDRDLNISDNTASGNLFLNPKFKFTNNRGSWFSLPLATLKNS